MTAAEVPAAGIAAGPKAYNPALIGISINDTKNLLENANLQAIADQIAAGVDIALGGNGTGTRYARSAPATDNIGYLQETNCLLSIGQRNDTVGNPLTGFDDAGQFTQALLILVLMQTSCCSLSSRKSKLTA